MRITNAHVTRILLLGCIVFLGLQAGALASPVTLHFYGGNLTVVGEYIGTTLQTTQIYAPLFQNGKTVTITIAYDTNQPDIDGTSNTGTYRVGSLSATIPELGLSASSTSSSIMQISAFNNTPNPDDQFLADASGGVSFSSNVGLPNPSAFWTFAFGGLSMLANDSLPTSPLNWTFGNLSFNFFDGTNTRQVLLTFTPAPLPTPVLTFLGTEDYTGSDGNPYTRYRLSVSNWQLYPADLFVHSTTYPACGLNTNPSRTWVDIYTGSGASFSRVYGFCDQTSPQDLTDIWFSLPLGQTPLPEAYVVLTDNLTGNTYTSNVLPIPTAPQPPSGYPPTSHPLNPGGSGGTGEVYQSYEFDNATFNFGVKYNPDPTIPENVFMVVQPILLSEVDLAARVAGTGFEGASLVPYDGTGGLGVLFRVTCEDAAHIPVACPPVPVNTFYNVKTAWYPPSLSSQPIVAPAFLKAPIGTNEWEDVLVSYYEDKIDGTAVARPCCKYSDFVFVDMREMAASSGKGTPLPTITINSPAANAQYALHSLFKADYTCTASDGTSLGSCVGTTPSGQPIDTSSVGPKTFEVTATITPDSSGKSVSYTQSVSYTVVSDNICLLYDPTRSVKKGAAYPIKLQVCDAAGKNLSASSIVLHADPKLVQKDKAADGPLQDSGNANPDSDFRFDSTLGVGGGYIYNLNTAGLSSGTWILYFTIKGDPVQHSTLFNLK